jgi:flagellar motor switch protein FliM
MLARTALAGPEDCVVWAELGVGIDHYLLLTVPRPFAAAACERLFGAPLIMGEDRELTPTEAHLIQDLGAGWVRLLNGVWEGCGARVTSAPDPAAPGGYGSSNWLRFTTDLQCGHVVGAVSVAMSPSTARVLLGEPAQARPDGAPASPELLMDIPLELHAILGEARFTMDELASLQIGDVIALERKVSEPIDIVVEGTRLFRSRAGLAGQMVALEIAGYAGGDASREC